MGEWDRQAIMALAQRQHGVLSRQQLFENSVTRRQLDRRVESNEWERLLPQVYRLAGTVRSFLQHAWACSLWAGADAYLSHHAAAWLWGFIDIEPQRIDLSADFKLHQPAQWLVAHKTNVPKAQHRERRGLPVTSPSRTLVDLAPHLSMDQRETVFAAAFRSRLADQFSEGDCGDSAVLSSRCLVAVVTNSSGTRTLLRRHCSRSGRRQSCLRKNTADTGRTATKSDGSGHVRSRHGSIFQHTGQSDHLYIG